VVARRSHHPVSTRVRSGQGEGETRTSPRPPKELPELDEVHQQRQERDQQRTDRNPELEVVPISAVGAFDDLFHVEDSPGSSGSKEAP
jgi:hypothetical protein